jgi:enamine deaminase RidA (YjgF/YER057c/UK114 family)
LNHSSNLLWKQQTKQAKMADSPNGSAYFRSSTHAQGLANYPHARIVPSGNARTIYVSGTSSRRGDGTFVGAQRKKDAAGNESLTLDVGLQTGAVLSNIAEIIKGATDGKADMRNVVDATVFLVDMERDYTGMNKEWDRVWPDRAQAPARTTVAVRALPRPEILVEIKCVVHLP